LRLRVKPSLGELAERQPGRYDTLALPHPIAEVVEECLGLALSPKRTALVISVTPSLLAGGVAVADQVTTLAVRTEAEVDTGALRPVPLSRVHPIASRLVVEFLLHGDLNLPMPAPERLPRCRGVCLEDRAYHP
jgi:hypothetical protein